jgi:hypothetical protein
MALMPHLPDGANVVFVCSGVEAMQPRDGDGVRARDLAAALQRRRTRLQPGSSGTGSTPARAAKVITNVLLNEDVAVA